MHKCPIDGCIWKLPQHVLMCSRHWRQVPKALRQQVYDAWNCGNPSSRYWDVRKQAIDSVSVRVERVGGDRHD